MPMLPGDGTSKMKLEKEIRSVCMVCNTEMPSGLRILLMKG